MIATATGSRTQPYSVTAAAVVLAAVVLLRVPLAALATMVIDADTRHIDVQAFPSAGRIPARRAGHLRRRRWRGCSVIRVARNYDAILGEVPGLAGMHDADDFIFRVFGESVPAHRGIADAFDPGCPGARRNPLGTYWQRGSADSKQRPTLGKMPPGTPTGLATPPRRRQQAHASRAAPPPLHGRSLRWPCRPRGELLTAVTTAATSCLSRRGRQDDRTTVAAARRAGMRSWSRLQAIRRRVLRPGRPGTPALQA